LKKLISRRDITMEMLNAVDGISCVKPLGAFYAYPRLENVVDDTHWVSEVIKATGVVVVPGSGFGQKPGTSHFRVVFLPPEETLRSAYGKIAEFHAGYKNL